MDVIPEPANTSRQEAKTTVVRISCSHVSLQIGRCGNLSLLVFSREEDHGEYKIG